MSENLGNSSVGISTNLTNLNNYLSQYNDLTCYIYFKVNDFELDTRDGNTFKHFAVSIENKKTGTGQGNEFTLKIAYHPNFSEVNNNIINNINKFEELMSVVTDASNGDLSSLSRGDCILKYGYIKQSGDVYQEYTGFGKLLKYTVTANKQIVEYTLSGYTGDKITVSKVNWYPGISEDSIESSDSDAIKWILYDDNGNPAKGNGYDDFNSLTTEEKIKALDNLGMVSLKANPYFILKRFIDEYNNSVTDQKVTNATTFSISYGSKGDNNKTELNEDYLKNNLKPVTVSLCRSQSPIEYIQYLIGMFSENLGEEDLLSTYKIDDSIEPRYTYEFVQKISGSDSVTNEVEVKISRLDPQSNYCDYSFYGYSPDNHLLISYDLEYDGTVALNAKTSLDSVDDTEGTIYIDAYGEIKSKVILTGSSIVSGNIDNVTVGESNVWLDNISVANKCTITTVGLPFEVPVNSKFNVGMYIGGELHHTSGICTVVGAVDKISNGIFNTTVSLVRLPGTGSGVKTN